MNLIMSFSSLYLSTVFKLLVSTIFFLDKLIQKFEWARSQHYARTQISKPSRWKVYTTPLIFTQSSTSMCSDLLPRLRSQAKVTSDLIITERGDLWPDHSRPNWPLVRPFQTKLTSNEPDNPNTKRSPVRLNDHCPDFCAFDRRSRAPFAQEDDFIKGRFGVGPQFG